MAEKVWYYCRPGGEVAGPVSSRRLKRMAADGRLARGDLLSRRPGGRQVRADAIAGLFAPAPPLPPPDPSDRPLARSHQALADADDHAGGLLDLGFTRFVTPKLVKVLWAVWLFAAVPLLTLAILAMPVMALLGGSVALPGPDGTPKPAGGPSVAAVVTAVVLAVVQLAGLALYTLLVRVGLESVVVLFRGAEAVMAIDARQRGEG